MDSSQHIQASASNTSNTGSRQQRLADQSDVDGALLEGLISGAVQAGFSAERNPMDGRYLDTASVRVTVTVTRSSALLAAPNMIASHTGCTAGQAQQCSAARGCASRLSKHLAGCSTVWRQCDDDLQLRQRLQPAAELQSVALWRDVSL